MAHKSYRGIVRQKTVFLSEDVPLADGTEVADEAGTVAAVLAAVNGPPHVPPEWVDELERLITEGQRMPAREDPFGNGT